MDEARFWKLLETAKAQSDGDLYAQIDLTKKSLMALSADEIVDFFHIYLRLRDLSYSNDLWGAAYLLKYGCSNDGFSDFQEWLMGQGEAIFYAALKDPEILVDVPNKAEHYILDLYVSIPKAYQFITGKEYPPVPKNYIGASLTGEDWEEDEELMTRYPKLAVKFQKFLEKDGY